MGVDFLILHHSEAIFLGAYMCLQAYLPHLDCKQLKGKDAAQFSSICQEHAPKQRVKAQLHCLGARKEDGRTSNAAPSTGSADSV